MRIAVTGASGLIGGALVPFLRRRGHVVVRFVRRPPAASDEVQWDPAAGEVDRAALEGVQAFINLTGAGVGDHRWTASYKREIRDSRVLGTGAIARSLAHLDTPPQVLVSGSAIGYYGNTGDHEVDERSPQGTGFLADVTSEWEAAADPARAAGIRVVHPRTGLVVARDGGAWGRMWPIFRSGLGGTLGNGRQWWSWISLRDEIAALEFLLHSDLHGPVNLTAPNPVTNAEVTDAMARILRRPARFDVPAAALRLVLGEFASEVLDSHRVRCSVLDAAGFRFADESIVEGLRSALLQLDPH